MQHRRGGRVAIPSSARALGRRSDEPPRPRAGVPTARWPMRSRTVARRAGMASRGRGAGVRRAGRRRSSPRPAVRMRARSGWAPAALALERSARLTPDRVTGDLIACSTPPRRLWMGGRIELTLSLTDELLAHGTRAPGRAAVIRLRGRIELHCGDVGHALDHLLEGAGLLAREDPAAATALLADAVEAAELLGEPRARARGRRTASCAHGQRATGSPPRSRSARRCGSPAGPADARPHLERALRSWLSARDDLRGEHACLHSRRARRGLARPRARGTRSSRDTPSMPRPRAGRLRAAGPRARRSPPTSTRRPAAGARRMATRRKGSSWRARDDARGRRRAASSTSPGSRPSRGTRSNCRAARRRGGRGGRRRRLPQRSGSGRRSGSWSSGSGAPRKRVRSYERDRPRGDSAHRRAIFVEALIRSGRTDEAGAARERMPAGRARRRRRALRSDCWRPTTTSRRRSRRRSSCSAEHDAFGRARTQLCFGRAAAPSRPPHRRPHRAAGRARRLRSARRAPVGGARRRRAARHRRTTGTPRGPQGRRAHPAGTAGRASGSRGQHEQGDRRRPVPQPKDGRLPPAPRVSQARRALPRRADPPVRRAARAEGMRRAGRLPNRHRRGPPTVRAHCEKRPTHALTDHPAMTILTNVSQRARRLDSPAIGPPRAHLRHHASCPHPHTTLVHALRRAHRRASQVQEHTMTDFTDVGADRRRAGRAEGSDSGTRAHAG